MLSFLLGSAAGEALQQLAPFIPAIKEHKVHLPGVDCQGHIDLFLVEQQAPIEAKSTRKRSSKYHPYNPMDVNAAYIDQLRFYMAMTDSPVGFFFIIHLTEMEPKKALTFIKMKMTPQELEEAKVQLRARAEAFLAAFMNKEPRQLPCVKGTEFEYQMKWCEYPELHDP